MIRDAHARPPESMRLLFKKWQKMCIEEIDSSSEVLDFASDVIQNNQKIRVLPGISSKRRSHVFGEFVRDHQTPSMDSTTEEPLRFEVKDIPGLFVYPSLISFEVQVALLNKILHRDLSDEHHQTNIHLHYEVPFPQDLVSPNSFECSDTSFFAVNQQELIKPKDPSVHRALTIRHMLERKLRWITLGGQYDWTAKAYPSEAPPQFPQDIALLLKGLFPDVDAQAAIVNFYSPGDTLSVHRDVSEDCDRGLISVSMGCDGLFIVGNDDGSHTATLRLRSGDVILMSGTSRYAWHAVPKVLAGTCPDPLRAWPTIDQQTAFIGWENWLANKRVNLNIRQMRA